MTVTIIAALAENRVIGREGALPWHLPADLAHFRAVTSGHPLIVGRRTWESIGRPLPGRTLIVVSRQPGYRADGCLVAGDLESALQLAAAAPGGDEVFVAGGAELYRQALPLADRLLLTLVPGSPAGDRFFPQLPADFQLLRSTPLKGAPGCEVDEWRRRERQL